MCISKVSICFVLKAFKVNYCKHIYHLISGTSCLYEDKINQHFLYDIVIRVHLPGGAGFCSDVLVWHHRGSNRVQMKPRVL